MMLFSSIRFPFMIQLRSNGAMLILLDSVGVLGIFEKKNTITDLSN